MKSTEQEVDILTKALRAYTKTKEYYEPGLAKIIWALIGKIKYD